MAGLLDYFPYGSPLMGHGTGEMPAGGRLNAPSISQAEELIPYLLATSVYRQAPRFPAWAKKVVKGGSRGRSKRGYPNRKFNIAEKRYQEHLDSGGYPATKKGIRKVRAAKEKKRRTYEEQIRALEERYEAEQAKMLDRYMDEVFHPARFD